mgnify:CR=1 FL=1
MPGLGPPWNVARDSVPVLAAAGGEAMRRAWLRTEVRAPNGRGCWLELPLGAPRRATVKAFARERVVPFAGVEEPLSAGSTPVERVAKHCRQDSEEPESDQSVHGALALRALPDGGADQRENKEASWAEHEKGDEPAGKA